MYLFEDFNVSEEWKRLYSNHYLPNSPGSHTNSNLRYDTNKLKCIANPLLSNILFIPNNHSTPNKKIANVKNSNSKNNSQSVSSLSFSTTYPNESCSSDSRSSIFNGNSSSMIPTVSYNVDLEHRNKYASTVLEPEIHSSRIRNKSVKGITCIMSLALQDENAYKKSSHVQACSITVTVIALVIISIALIFISSHKHIPIANVNVPIAYNRTSNVPNLEERIFETLVVRQNVAHDEVYSNNTTSRTKVDEEMADEAIGPQVTQVSETIIRIRGKIRTFLKSNKSSSATVRGNNDDPIRKLCSKCKAIEEVCMLNESTGTPYCAQVLDKDDPTGCGGRCILESEACTTVARRVHVCRVLNEMTCPSNMWRCKNGLCVHKTARCDGRIDCYDRSDELMCECDLRHSFRCGNGVSCFPKDRMCDGTTDCWDGFDEANCARECGEGLRECMEKWCEGRADCSLNWNK